MENNCEKVKLYVNLHMCIEPAERCPRSENGNDLISGTRGVVVL
jgi:hypothetical protein